MAITLTGQSEQYTILGSVQASDDDLAQIAKYTGAEVLPEEVAIVEAVAFDGSKNANGWQVSDPSKVSCVGATLNYDHSTSAKDSVGVVFAERCDTDNRKIVKAAIPKTSKNADVLADIKFRVASKLSPMLKVDKWASEKEQIVESGSLVHLSFVQNPAYGADNKVLSLAASEEPAPNAFEVYGRAMHEQNVTRATRLAERKAGGYTVPQREEAKSKYAAMAPDTLVEMIGLLEDSAKSKENPTTSQKTVSAQTTDSAPTTLPKPLFPYLKEVK